MPQNVTRQRPCPICGKPDMCFSDVRTDGVKVTVCGRVHQDMVNGSDGRVYKLLPTQKNTVYSMYVDYEEDLIRSEERRREWCIAHGYAYKPRKDIDISSLSLPPVEEVWEYDKNIIQPLPHRVLDSILRPWIEEDLVLSPYHYEKLMSEWKLNPKAAEVIFATWPIRSMPVEDQWREDYPAFYKKWGEIPWRKELMQRLIKRCQNVGLKSPMGIPGIYQDKESGQWLFAAKSGILYPVYDAAGFIYRLRIGTDFPDVKGMYNGMTGFFRFYRNSWYFERNDKPREEKNILVWRFGYTTNKIKLNQKGLPEGKPDGKYVNMSSFKEWKDYDRHVIVNKYFCGCRSGSKISVYRPQNARKGVFWITEGEKKAMVIAALLGVTVLCVPGVNNYPAMFKPVENGPSIIEVLKAEGMIMAVVAFDADKDVNEMVSAAEEGLIHDLLAVELKVGKTKWNKAFGKGLDDSLLAGARPSIELVS